MKKSLKAVGLSLSLVILFTLVFPIVAFAAPDIWALSIKIDKKPAKTHYYYGDSLDLSGMKVSGTFKKASGETYSGDITHECYIDPADQILTGEGKRTIRVYADLPDEDGSLDQFSATFSITIYSCNAASFKTKSLSDGVVGEKYSQAIKVNDNNSGPYTITVYYNPGKENNFPKGLKLSSDGKISGTPTKAGKFRFWVMLSNNYGDDYKEYTIVIKEPETTPQPDQTPEAPTPTPTQAPQITQTPTPIPPQMHEHKAGPAWKSDPKTHWHECECGERMDEAAHEVVSWQRVEDRNKQIGVCATCGQVVTREAAGEQGVASFTRMEIMLFLIIGVLVFIIIAASVVMITLTIKNEKKRLKNAVRNDHE